MFGFLGKKARTEVGPVASFGKVPALGDFVRTSAPSDELLAFEAWVTRAMETGEARAGTAFKEAFASAAPHAFLWSGSIDKKHRGLLAGVLVPSHDAVGRRFPLVVGAPLPSTALAAEPHVAPLVLHDFFLRAASAASRAARTRSHAEYNAQVASVTPPALGRPVSDAYDAWTRTTRAADVWGALFDHDAERAARYAVHLLIEATASYRGQDAPPLALGVRVPLADDAAAMTAMWIDLVRRAAGWKTTIPSVFFSLSGGRVHALIQLGAEAPSSVLTDLYTGASDSETVCDVTPSTEARLPSVFPPTVERAVGAPGALVADVLRELGRA